MKDPQTQKTGKNRGAQPQAVVQTGVEGQPVLAIGGFNLRAAEVALLRHAAQHAETLAAAAAMLGLSERQLRRRARQLRVALPFAARRGGRS